MAGSLNLPVLEQNEVVKFLENDSYLKEIESNYQCIDVKDIQEGIDFSLCAVKGVITKVYPSFQTPRGWIKKLHIIDLNPNNQSDLTIDVSDPTAVMPVFLRGSLVEKCTSLKENDLLMITGAEVEKSAIAGYKFNIVASEKRDLKIWVVQYTNKKMSSTVLATVPKPVESSDLTAVEKKVCDREDRVNEPPFKRCKLVLHPKIETYTRLADLKVNAVVNIYGVIKFFKSPFKTKGSDYVCTLSLVDQSFDCLDKGFKCVLFSKSKERLPPIKSVGDMVRFHHFGVGQYRGELQGKFLPDSSWIVFDSSNCVDTPQVRASSKSYVLTDRDRETIRELKEWSTHKETLNKQFAFTTLQDLTTSQNFVNLLCQLVSRSYTANGAVMLTLWDGSHPACQSIPVGPITEQGRITSDELIRKAGKRCVAVFLYDDHVSGDIIRAVPGDFLCLRNVHLREIKEESNVMADKSKSAHIRPLVSLEVHSGTICGRGVEILPPDDPVVTSSAIMKLIAEAEVTDIEPEQCNVSEINTVQRERISSAPSAVCEKINTEQRERIFPDTSAVCEEKQAENKDDANKQRYQKALSANVESRSLQTSCTITEHPCVPFTSLKDIKTCRTIPNKFRCRVKALVYLPSDVRRFVRKSCQSCRYLFAEHSDSNSSDDVASSERSILCSRCNQDAGLVYLFSLVIEDESALLHAMVFDQDVAFFFPALPPPQNFVEQTQIHESLGEWMFSMTQNSSNSLEFVNQDPRGDKRPWLELCIMSYFPQGNEGNGKILYRVFDSTFVGES